MSNVLFTFVMGLLILTFGMYGRVTGGLAHDNPYWRRRHPRQAARESLAARRRERARTALTPARNPATGLPVTGLPATGLPVTGVPATEVPATGAPATGAPATHPRPGG